MQQTNLNIAPAPFKSYLVALRSPTRFSLFELPFFMAVNQPLTLQLLPSTANKFHPEKSQSIHISSCF
jgi:hypothetical protein